MEKDWVKLVSLGNRQKADILLTLLESEGISAVLLNKQDSVYNFGEVELYCHGKDALRALEIIEFNFPL